LHGLLEDDSLEATTFLILGNKSDKEVHIDGAFEPRLVDRLID